MRKNYHIYSQKNYTVHINCHSIVTKSLTFQKAQTMSQRTIASLEGVATSYNFIVNKHGHIVAFIVQEHTNKVWNHWKWTLKPHAINESCINTLEFNHDTFEGLVSRLGIDPEVKLSDEPVTTK